MGGAGGEPFCSPIHPACVSPGASPAPVPGLRGSRPMGPGPCEAGPRLRTRGHRLARDRRGLPGLQLVHWGLQGPWHLHLHAQARLTPTEPKETRRIQAGLQERDGCGRGGAQIPTELEQIFPSHGAIPAMVLSVHLSITTLIRKTGGLLPKNLRVGNVSFPTWGTTNGLSREKQRNTDN